MGRNKFLKFLYFFFYNKLKMFIFVFYGIFFWKFFKGNGEIVRGGLWVRDRFIKIYNLYSLIVY